ncbi:MAG: GNAT family N-acetyltransferase [Lachnospiraceae bacterium]|nr:GNAT family N-acetyltransferase [Lachnospiraceae bacterium]
MDINEIRALEKMGSNGWKAMEIQEYDGWEIRFGNGYTGRANSVSVYEDSTKRPEDKVVYCENLYSSKGLPCIFKMTDADKELSEYLLNRGYKVVTPTDVMILDTDTKEFADILANWKKKESDTNETDLDTKKSEITENAIFSDDPSDWFDLYFEYEGFTDEKKIEAYKQFHYNTTVTKLYVTLLHEGKPAAVASCAIEDGYSLLHNVIVDEKYRGLGLGKKLCLAAILKSKEMGAKYSYLQVIKDNEVAISLYNKLGYKKIYEYCYLKKS